MNWRDEDTLLDIEIAAKRIIEFQQGLSDSDFLQDVKTQAAIQHQFMVMGEATKRLSQEIRTQHPDVPWAAMAGMRDRLIHGYERVSLEIVWDTATIAVPALLEQLAPLLSQEADPQETDDEEFVE